LNDKNVYPFLISARVLYFQLGMILNPNAVFEIKCVI